MSNENLTETKSFFDKIPDSLKSRKFWGSVAVTVISVLNAWLIAQRPLDVAEIASIAGIWGVYSIAEGAVDSARAKSSN